MQFIDLKAQQALIRPELDRRIAAVLDHGQYILGPEIDEMERRLAEYVGAAHCVSVSSGTDALSIALMALGIEAGDEVITTPFSFIATAETVALLGARPVFVDVDPRTYNLDPARIEAAIGPRTRAILPVGLYGQCADMEAIGAVAAAHGLPVVEDAAQSFGATYRGRRSCALSAIGCTSFFPAKPLGCYGDGGACFTDDPALAARMREIRNHGQDRRYHHPILGLNGRMDTLQAAVILAKLPIFDAEVAARERIGARYSVLLDGANCVTPWIAPGSTSVYAQYTLQVGDREALIKALHEKGIPTAVHYPVTLDRQPALARWQPGAIALPVAHRLADRVVSLPMHPYLDEATIEAVAAAVIEATAGMPDSRGPASA
jgi:UDP-2-acetamido-2-deoxy-ribo-hexuluronate aminotransferase